MVKLKGLGRGLDALLGADETKSVSGHPSTLQVSHMQPGRYQPRTRMDVDSLNELAQSISAQGLLQPILVRPVGTDRYEIIAGERRWRAAQLAGLKEVPVLVRDIADEATLAVALIENIQREDLNPLEEALGLERLINEFGMTHEQAAGAVGRSRSAVSNLLRLINLSEGVRALLMEGQLEMGHGRALLALTESQQIVFARNIIAQGLSVRETEKKVQALQGNKTAKPKAGASRDLIRLQDELSDHLGASVTLKTNRAGTGAVTIRYHSLDQLEGLLQRLRA
jgi:ParB family transcriptional regulator, chromosome partitioning protein